MSDKNEWMEEVLKIAQTYGWNKDRAMMFEMDIEICYQNGDSPEECVSKVF